MAAAATRELTGVTTLLFDHSEEIYGETRKLARQAEIRHATTVAALRDMQRLSISMDSGASTALGAGGLAGGHLETVLAQCKASFIHLRTLEENRVTMVEASRDATMQQTVTLEAQRLEMKAAFDAQRKAADAQFLKGMADAHVKHGLTPSPVWSGTPNRLP